jgi:hypothetical protein
MSPIYSVLLASSLLFVLSGCYGFERTSESGCSYRRSSGYDGGQRERPINEGDGYVSFTNSTWNDTGGGGNTNFLLQCGAGVGIVQSYSPLILRDVEQAPDTTPIAFAHFREVVDAWREIGRPDFDGLRISLASSNVGERFIWATDDDSVATCACALHYPTTEERWARGDK